ncbi:cytochrome P450 [Streptomyces sp. NPDC017529]|uniref:cytochrome P450 n=1 Tax=Streptomyces sp. NPDC017529 TaxID=3365000 RepID=UPI0037A46DB4
MTRPQELPPHSRRDRFDPDPELVRMARETPLVKTDVAPGPSHRLLWLATGRPEVRAVLSDAERFSTMPPADSAEDTRKLALPGNLLQHDPPTHTRLRKLLTPEFTMQRIRRLEPRVEEVVADCLDTMESTGPPVDLMRHFSWPIAGLISCELLGVPRDDQTELAHYLGIAQDEGRPADQQLHAGKAYGDYMTKLAAQRRRRPGDDLLGVLVREHGTEVTDDELAGLGKSLAADGFGQGASMLGLGVAALLDHPDQLALLRDRPELIERAVEELLRYVTVIQTASPRTALEEVTVGDQVIGAGETVVCSLLAANRVPGTGDEPDRLDITREPGPHLAFGHGIHRCLGAQLITLELSVAYPALLRRFPALRPAVPPEEIRFRASQSPQYGLVSLPVTW